MRLVVLESPYAGDITRNVQYARACVRDCLMRGESPIASHLLYTQENILKDEVPGERKLGITAGHAWMPKADAVVIYFDYGISPGMEAGEKLAFNLQIPVEYRQIGRVCE
jgi:hypothetical protein